MPGSFSTQAPVIDAIRTMIAALPAVKDPIPPVMVFDGFPGVNLPPTFIAIGGFSPKVVGGGRQRWETIGSRSRIEEYSVAGYVYSWVGGDDSMGQFSPEDAQKASRDRASELVQAIEAQMLHDPTLSEQNGGQQLITWGLLSVTDVDQTSAEDPEAAKGRWTQFAIAIDVYNYLSGSY